MPEAVVAITGASGALYAERLLRALSEAKWDVLLIVTREGAINLDLEMGLSPENLAELPGVSLENNEEGLIHISEIANEFITDINQFVKVGDIVLYGKYSMTELKHEGQDFIIMRESDIFGIIS